MTQTEIPAEPRPTAGATTQSAARQTRNAWSLWLGRYHWVIALAGYVVLTVILTYPAVWHLGDAVLGPYAEGDNLWYVWYPWQFRSAVSAGHDPAYTHLIFALFPQVQIFAASYFSGAFGALLLGIMSPLAAYNVLVLLGFVLSGFTMYLLAGEFIRNRWVCFIAGFLYTFSTFHFWHATGQLSLATMQWLPLAAWRIFAFYRRPTWLNALWMGLSVAIVPLSDLYLAAYFLLPFGVLFVGGLLIFRRDWLANWRHLLRAGLGVAITALVALPPLLSSLRVSPDLQAAIAIKASSASTYASNLLAYIFPQPANPLFGRFTGRLYQHMASSQYPIEQSNYLGVVIMGLGASAFLYARNRTRAAYFWLALTILAFLLSLGPSLQIGGHVLLPLPFYNLFYNWPILSNFRAPNRIGPVILLGACVLAGFGLNSLFEAVPGFVHKRARAWRARAPLVSRFAVVALGVLVMSASLAEHAQFGLFYTTTPIHVPAVYAEMAADPVPGLVLTLPVYPRGVEMFDQTVHHRAIVTGYAIRTSYAMIRSFENVPYVSLFDWPDSAAANDPSADLEGRLHDIFPLTETFKQGLQQYGIRYVVLRTAVFPPIEPWMRPFLVSQLGAPFYDSTAEGVTVWRIDPGSVDPSLYQFKLGSGWRPGLRVLNNDVIRIVLQDAQLQIVAPQAAPRHLLITASAAAPRTLIVSLNGRVIQTVAFTQTDVPQTIDLGTVPLQAGQNTLELKSQEPCATPDAGIEPTLDPNCAAFNVSQVQMSTP